LRARGRTRKTAGGVGRGERAFGPTILRRGGSASTTGVPKDCLAFKPRPDAIIPRQWQELIHGNRISHSYTEALPDFVMLAKAFGWGARRVEKPGELDGALQECLAHPGPFFLDVRVTATENCFPMMPAGRGHHEVMLAPDQYYKEDA
jgi:hypothetical protein